MTTSIFFRSLAIVPYTSHPPQRTLIPEAIHRQELVIYTKDVYVVVDGYLLEFNKKLILIICLQKLLLNNCMHLSCKSFDSFH